MGSPMPTANVAPGTTTAVGSRMTRALVIQGALQGAIQGAGRAFVAEHEVAAHLHDGQLVRVLHDWCQPYPGFFLSSAGRRQQPAALKALLSVLRS